MSSPGRTAYSMAAGSPILARDRPPHDEIRMPPVKKTPTTTDSKPRRGTSSSADLNTTIAEVTPDVLELLRDGVPRSRATIVAALADRHAREDVKRTLMRLAILGQLEEKGGKHTLASAEAT